MKKKIYLLIVLVLFQCKYEPIEKNPNIQEQPNILFFLVDDQRNDTISCAGHPIIQTPTLDFLATNGIRFINTYVTSAICAASRASILTGLYENKHNYTFGKPPLKTEFSTSSYPYLLKKLGYKTGFIGKFGVKLEKRDSIINQLFDFYKPSPRNAPHFVTLEDGTKRHSAEICGDEAITFIKNQSTDTPFCLSISFNSVHAVDSDLTPGNKGHYPYPQSVASLYENVEIPEPKLSDPQIYENHPDFIKNSLNRERFFWRWDTKEKYQINMRAYYRMISGYDKVMERVINVLYEKGFDKNTIIIFSADNGYYMGNRGFAGKWTHYEESLRVPLIIYDPRKPKKDTHLTSDKIALNIDIAPTILDYVGLTPPNGYQGQSLLPLINNQNPTTWREDFICEHRMNHPKIPKYVGVHGKRYVYANYYEQNPPYEYLHDLAIDPNQLKNLVERADYQEILKKIRAKNVRQIKRVGKN
ncbi:MAG: sulfatase [Bacteroidetes bacterium]|jgi:arylsulfatase A-like enzyme|nr:sulfatase [Bacteroidota bacterium]